jgi:hypothetical protein
VTLALNDETSKARTNTNWSEYSIERVVDTLTTRVKTNCGETKNYEARMTAIQRLIFKKIRVGTERSSTLHT